MAHFYETISNNKINYSLEYAKTRQLFEIEKITYYNNGAQYLSLKDLIDSYFFRKIDLSYNYTSVKTFLDDVISSAKDECDVFVLYVEAVLSLIYQFLSNFIFSSTNKTNILNKVNEINRIIGIDLELMSATRKQIKSKLGDVIIIIPKDELLENVLESISEDDIKMKLIEYKHRSNEGNIKGKEDILRSIYPFVEGIIKSNHFQHNKRLFEDTDFLYNNLHLRHNNKKTNDTRFYIETLSNREAWLDLVYRETLLVVSSTVEYEDHGKIKALKNKVNPKEG